MKSLLLLALAVGLPTTPELGSSPGPKPPPAETPVADEGARMRSSQVVVLTYDGSVGAPVVLERNGAPLNLLWPAGEPSESKEYRAIDVCAPLGTHLYALETATGKTLYWYVEVAYVTPQCQEVPDRAEELLEEAPSEQALNDSPRKVAPNDSPPAGLGHPGKRSRRRLLHLPIALLATAGVLLLFVAYAHWSRRTTRKRKRF